jgi:hypothetical protein
LSFALPRRELAGKAKGLYQALTTKPEAGGVFLWCLLFAAIS